MGSTCSYSAAEQPTRSACDSSQRSDQLASRDLHRDSSSSRVAAPTPRLESSSHRGTYTAIRVHLASRHLHRDSSSFRDSSSTCIFGTHFPSRFDDSRSTRVAEPTPLFETHSRRGTNTAIRVQLTSRDLHRDSSSVRDSSSSRVAKLTARLELNSRRST